MKLLLIVDAFRGGAGNVMQILAGQLRRRGHRVTMLLLNGAIDLPKHDLTGVQVIEYPLVQNEPAKTPIGRLLRYKRAVKRLIREVSPDAVLSFLTEYNCLTAWNIGGKLPLVISERNNPFQEKAKPQWVFLRKHYYQKADKLVVQCKEFADFYPPAVQKKICVIPNPILTPKVTAGEQHEYEVRLVSMGRLHPQKNYPWMIEAVCRVHAQNPTCRLTIYGSGEEEARLRALIEERGAGEFITLAGKTDTPHAVLAESDVYLMTSDYEGFPNALSEAMAVGLPSVSRICHEGLRDLVEEGVNGYLVSPDDMDGFVRRVLTLAADPELSKEMGDRAKSVAARYGVSGITDRFEDALREAVELHVKHRKERT
ncbi:MAG: glycosyltransferase [Clostridia bacterium]|nr:glycosyltransferase [Clostridia bacterium]